MKKIFIFIFLFLFIFLFQVSSLFAEEKLDNYSPMSLYRSNYLIAGDNDNQVKFQFSAKISNSRP